MKKRILFFVLLVGIVGTALAFGGHASFMKDPARMVVKVLDFRLDLSDAQEAEVLKLLQPAVAELREERMKQIGNPGELIKKVGEGKLTREDVVSVMEKRQKFVQAHQEKISTLVMGVYQILSETQKKELASIIQEHADKLLK